MTWTLRRLDAREIDHELLWGSVAIAMGVLGLAVLASIGLPAIPCPFKALTGLPCITCGTTRMIEALRHGHPGAAFRYNPLMSIAAGAMVPLVLYAWTVVLLRTRRVRLTVSPAGGSLVRAAVWMLLAANWVFLVIDGR